MRKINSRRLLEIMLERGLDVRDVAKATGISASVLSSAIRHGRQCYFSTISKLSKFFGVEPNELIDPADQLH